MAKDNRNIVNGVRLGEAPNVKLFVDGQEDELAAAATPEQIERLKANGSITGDWQATASQSSTPPTLTESVTEKLQAANLVIDAGLQNIGNDDLKAAGLQAAQIKNVRAVYGDFKPVE